MGFSKHYQLYKSIILSLLLTLPAGSTIAGQHSVSTEVQENITLLQETKNCPECNLSGAELNRMDLSGANLQGANLSRAKMFLTNLSGANLQNSDLREAQFGGADLANADLRGADLTGASLAGAYLVGTVLDGEMVTTSTTSGDDEIGDAEETVYVEDTVKAKSLPETEDMTIGSRRDFEETPPSIPVEVAPTAASAVEAPIASVPEDAVDSSVSVQSVTSPDAKEVPVIQEVRIQEKEEEPQVLLTDTTKKQLHQDDTPPPVVKAEEPVAEVQEQSVIESNPTETDEVKEASPQEDAGETVAATPVVQTVPEDVQPDIQEEAHAMASTEVIQENQEADATQNTVVANTEIPQELPGETPQKEITEEIVQANQGVNELEEKLSVHGPGSELFENIERLLDTNQCYGCNLGGANLTGENLEDADLEGADLSNALLQNADLEGANLKGANLSGADLSGADLSEADLYKAVLTDADLTNANLEDTLLDDADLSGVKGYQGFQMLNSK